MRFVYSSKMCMRVRHMVSCVLLFVGCACTVAIAQKPSGIGVDKPAITPAFRFSDITASAGILFQHTVVPEKKYLIESMVGGVLLLDYDGDGWLDIYFTNAPSVEMALQGQKAKSALYRNNHDGTFTDVTDKAGVGYPCWAMGGAVGDYNNDGWPDMLITCEEGIVLFRNNGDGTFADVTKQAHLTDPRWSAGAAFADYDGDGFADLMVSRYVEFDLKNLPQFGVGVTCRFRGIPVQCGPRGMKGLGDSLYHNNGDGTFTDVSKAAGLDDASGYYGLGLVWSDFNDDGKPDLFIADDSTPSYLYRNDGNGHFTDVSYISGTAVSSDGGETAGMGVAVCDFNHSGRFSIHMTNFEDQSNSLYRNDGDMAFTDVAYPAGIAQVSIPFMGWGTGCVDFDNDGWADLFVVDGHVYPQVDALASGGKYRQRKLVFLNKKDGTFADVSNALGDAVKIPQASRGAAFGDLDNDGRIDVVVENIDGSPMVLHNEGSTSHWITLQLIGVKSNRLALGAKVKVVSGALVQVDEVRSGSSYLSQNDLRVHFGVGSADKVDRVEIRWPGGGNQTVSNLAADRIYVVKEGEGIVAPEQTRPRPVPPSPAISGQRSQW
ncbi:MAG: CRTAC1 family protein [Acidobacteria bacterium]|nr:CRTAC1 family protein [Acidobacteriota bacterium]